MWKHLLPAGLFLWVVGCWMPTDIRPGLTFATDPVEVVDHDGERVVRARMVIHNTSAEPVDLSWGTCPGGFALSMYRSPDRSGEPVWHSIRNAPGVCVLVEHQHRLGPGEEYTLERFVPVDLILGTGGAEQEYYFTISPSIDSPRIQGPELPAGSVRVTR